MLQIKPMNASQVIALVKQGFPEAEVDAIDLTGTQDHWRIIVIDSQFEAMSLLKQHQAVMQTVQDYLGDGKPIHAVEIKTAAH